MTPVELLERELDFVRRAVLDNCRRSRFSPQDCEDFQGRVMLKLVADDYAVLRKFKGGSKLRTYLAVVVGRECSDFRNHLWGKWRPSEAAKRLGYEGIRFDELVNRDGLSPAEAVAVLRESPAIGASDNELEEIAARLPARPRRCLESEEILHLVESDRPDPEQKAIAAEREAANALRVKRLEECLAEASEEERLIIKLHFDDGIALSRVATMLGDPPRRMYSRLDRIKRSLRDCLKKKGAGAGAPL